MPHQYGTAVRNAILEAVELACNGQTLQAGAITGTAAQPRLRILTGAPPALPANAQTGTQLVEITLPADWQSNAASGVKALLGTWQGTAAAAGTAGHYRIVDNSGSVCHEQGTCGQQVTLNTSAATAVNGNVLTFAATTGVVAGMNATGAGVPDNTTVVAVTGTTVTLSSTCTAGVSSGAGIAFAPDLVLNNAVLAVGQQVTISTFTRTAPNA